MRTPVAIRKPPFIYTFLTKGGLALRTLGWVINNHEAYRSVQKSVKLLVFLN